MNDEALLRYSRHILLEGVDINGQEKLIASSALIVGAGGLGCAAALYLAASGVGTLIIADDDVVEISNLQRQIAHTTADIGNAKVLSLASSLRAINPDIQVVALQERLAGMRLQQIVKSVDIVLDCSDNFSTRHAINRTCVMYKKTLISGAAIRFEGQVAVFNRTSQCPCYACLYAPNVEDENLTCSESGVLAPLVGIVGTLQAAQVLRILMDFDWTSAEKPDNRLQLIDVRCMEWRTLNIRKDPHCAVCAVNPSEVEISHV